MNNPLSTSDKVKWSKQTAHQWNSSDFIVINFTAFVQILFKQWRSLSQWSIHCFKCRGMFQMNRRLFKLISYKICFNHQKIMMIELKIFHVTSASGSGSTLSCQHNGTTCCSIVLLQQHVLQHKHSTKLMYKKPRNSR